MCVYIYLNLYTYGDGTLMAEPGKGPQDTKTHNAGQGLATTTGTRTGTRTRDKDWDKDTGQGFGQKHRDEELLFICNVEQLCSMNYNSKNFCTILYKCEQLSSIRQVLFVEFYKAIRIINKYVKCCAMMYDETCMIYNDLQSCTNTYNYAQRYALTNSFVK